MNREKNLQRYKTATKLSIEDFKNYYEGDYKLHDKDRRFIVVGEDGKEYSLKKNSLRYATFNRDTKCQSCGIEGEYYLLQMGYIDESNIHGYYHANLYGVDSNGEEVLMTKDHIIRKEDGGTDDIDNLQTMCWHCNCVVKK